MIPNGYQVAGEFSQTSDVVSVPAGAGFGTTAPQVVCTRRIPGGAKAFLERFSARVVDAGNADQIYFSVRRNNQAIGSSLVKIPGIQFDFTAQIGIEETIDAGEVEIVAFNKSGTSEPDAAAAIDIRVQAWWAGALLRGSK